MFKNHVRLVIVAHIHFYDCAFYWGVMYVVSFNTFDSHQLCIYDVDDCHYSSTPDIISHLCLQVAGNACQWAYPGTSPQLVS